MAHDSGGMNFQSLQHGAPVSFFGEDVGGTNRNLMSMDPDGAWNVSYAGVLKLATTSTGIGVTGSVVCTSVDATGEIAVGNVGGSGLTDLRSRNFYGSNSIRTNATTGDMALINADLDGVTAALNVLTYNRTSGGCSLYNSGAEKLATTSAGVDVTGALEVSAGVDVTGTLEVSAEITADSNITCQNTVNTSQRQVKVSNTAGSNVLRTNTTTGDLRLFNADADGSTNVEDVLTYDRSLGTLTLYSGDSPKIELTSSGATVLGDLVIGDDLAVEGYVGFNNKTPTARDTITGNSGGTWVVVQQILTALDDAGLLIDSTT